MGVRATGAKKRAEGNTRSPEIETSQRIANRYCPRASYKGFVAVFVANWEFSVAGDAH